MKTIRTHFILTLCLLTLLLLVLLSRPVQADSRSTNGQAIALRNGAYLEVADTVFENDSIFTVEMWFRTTTVDSAKTLLIHHGPANSLYLFRTHGDHSISFTVRDSDLDTQHTFSSMPLNDGRWHHIAGVRSGATFQLYVDGVLDATTTNAAIGDLNAGGALQIGYWSAHGALDMEVTEVRIWNTARTAFQIDQLLYVQSDGTNSGLVGYWPLEQGNGTTFADGTSNGSNGTIIGTGARTIGRAWWGTGHQFGATALKGLGVDANTFITEKGDDFTAIPSTAAFGVTTNDVPMGVLNRWEQEWFVTAEDVAPARAGTVDIYFDISEAGGSGVFNASDTYSLLVRPLSGGTFSVAPTSAMQVSGDRVTFTLDASVFNPTMQRVTIGSNNSLTAVGLGTQQIEAQTGLLVVLLLMVGLVAVSGGVVFGRNHRNLSD